MSTLDAASVARRGQRSFDAVSFLSVYLVLLLAIPSALVVPALGAAGAPALLWAMLGGLWWLTERLRLRQPVLWSLGLIPSLGVSFAVAVTAAYIFAIMRTAPAVEGNTADTGMLRVIAWLGVLLITYHGITSHDRLVTLVRRIVLAGGLMGGLGLLQFVTDQSLIDWIAIPGLDSIGVETRSGFTRAAGTALHPLEFAVVVTVALPLAAALARHDYARGWLVRWLPLGAIIGALAVSGSRSAVIGLVAAVLFMAVGWPRHVQAKVLAGGLVVGLAVYMLVPGMASTVLDLFQGVGQDASSQSRIEAYGLALWVVSHSPWFGRGLGTFVPGYVILDNQYLLLLVEVGILGLLAFMLLVAGGVHSAVTGRRSAWSDLNRDVGQGIVAAILAGAILLLFFDGLSFTKVGGLLFLLLGLAGACRRLVRVSSEHLR